MLRQARRGGTPTHRGRARGLQLPSRNTKPSVSLDAGAKAPNTVISSNVPGPSSRSQLFSLAPFPIQTEVVFSIVNALKAERDELPSCCNELKGCLQDAEEEFSHAAIVQIALAKRTKTPVLENRCRRAEMQSLPRTVKDASNAGFDQKPTKRGYILPTVDVKYESPASKLLASAPKYCSR